MNSSWKVRRNGACARAARTRVSKNTSTVSANAETITMTRASRSGGQLACNSSTVRPPEMGISRKSSAATVMPSRLVASDDRRIGRLLIRLGTSPKPIATAVTATTSELP